MAQTAPLEVFGRDADDLIREIVRLGGTDDLERPQLNLIAFDPVMSAGPLPLLLLPESRERTPPAP
jgi:hypothetical protein